MKILSDSLKGPLIINTYVSTRFRKITCGILLIEALPKNRRFTVMVFKILIKHVIGK